MTIQILSEQIASKIAAGEVVERPAAVVKELVDKPDEVSINPIETEQQIIYELTVGDGDFGKVIGKGGKNISALRSLVFAINAKKRGKRAKLDVIDNKNG